MHASSKPCMAPSRRPSSDAGGAPPEAAQFPAGLRVLVVDDDPTCLKILEMMLTKCLYDVTTCSRAVVALSMLRAKRGGFDLVLSDVHMPDFDGFKLLEHIGLEMDLPVIMMSADEGKDVVMKGVKHGACDYLIKPVRMEALKTIWQHVIRRRRNELNELEQSGSVVECDKQKRGLDDSDNASSGNEKIIKRRKEGKEEEDEIDEHEDSSTMKRPRVVWSAELHLQFVSAVNKLGIDKAVPKKILDLMSVPGLTRENVASHLQKYRLYLRRVSTPPHQGRFDTPFTSATESGYGPSSSLDSFDFQTLAVIGQLPPQSFMAMHTGPPRKITNTATGIPAVDQISFLNSDVQNVNSSGIWSDSVQLLNNKQVSLLCGPPTNMQSTQSGQLQQAVQPFGTSGFLNLPSSLGTSSLYPGGIINWHLNNSSVIQMTRQEKHFSLSQQQNHTHIDMQHQTQLRGQLLNGFAGEHNSTLSSTILSNEISGHVSGRGGATINGNRSLAGTYMNTSSYAAVPQAQYAGFQNTSMTDSDGSCYPLVSSIGVSSHASAGTLQETMPAVGSVEELSNMNKWKGVKDFLPSYDLFSEHQGRNQDWKLQKINLSYESTQHVGSNQNNIDFGSATFAHQDLNATLKDGSSRNSCTVRKERISPRAEIEHKVGSIPQHNSTYLVENSVRLKAESMQDPSCHNVLFLDNNVPDELMSIGQQQQQGAGQAEAEFNFDGYPLDDILV